METVTIFTLYEKLSVMRREFGIVKIVLDGDVHASSGEKMDQMS